MEFPLSNTMNLFAGGTIAVGTAYAPAFKVPADSLGGGLTVIEAGIVSRAAIAAGSAPVLELVYFGTNSAVVGTIGTVAAGAFTAGTVKQMTITSTFVDADQFVGWKVMGTAVNPDQIHISAYVNYVPGK